MCEGGGQQITHTHTHSHSHSRTHSLTHSLTHILTHVELTLDFVFSALCPVSSGEDLLSLLFALLDEFLFRFSAEDFLVCKRVEIVEFDTENWKIKVRG